MDYGRGEKGMRRRVNVGVIGFGTIGAGVVRILLSRRSVLKQKTGLDIRLKYICDKDFSYDRGIGKVPQELQVKDWKKVVVDPEVDVVVELVGGTKIAGEIVLTALRQGKSVVTANKALLSERAKEILSIGIPGKNLFFEASVCGAIPVVKTIREALVTNKIKGLYGIVNGTCNYILSSMFESSLEFKVALEQAQHLGYAEKDPILDIEGIDSSHKISILSMLAFGKYVHPDKILTEGISRIELIDLLFAADMGYRVKLLAIAQEEKEGLDIRVHPALIPEEHMLSNISGVFNGLYLRTDTAGDMLLYGRGAGRFPTASAVVSDIVDAARERISGIAGREVELNFSPKVAEIESRYYIRFTVVDRPGVLAKISGILGKHCISISSVHQTERAKGRNNTVPLILLTHEASEKEMSQAIKEISKLDVVKRTPVLIRIMDL